MEPILSMAFSMNANRGAYALLLGSGLSRAASIPTGWEITVGLVEQLAQLEQEDVGADPVAWYVGRFGKQPDYSELLDQLAPTPVERCLLLKRYFEPDEDERAQGIKRPTAAHRAIARMMKDGFIRVVLTTNFDRLLEDALAEVGAPPPTVIGSGDAVDGALPLSHPGTFIVKIHGDYLDMRIKNTVAELSEYDPRMDQLLDRVLDEFGLITCGWSSEWDIALKRVFERCKGRRFGTYWTYLPPLNVSAQGLITLRGAQALEIKGADEFFIELDEKVRSLAESNRSHPLSLQAAIGTIKRYVVDDQQRVRLHDLFQEESERLYEQLSITLFPTRNVQPTPAAYVDQIRRYDSTTERLAALLIQGCYWGAPQHQRIWIKIIERIAHLPDSEGGYGCFLKLRRYPCLRLLFAAGLAALAGGHVDTLYALFVHPRVTSEARGQNDPLITNINYMTVTDESSLFDPLFNNSGRYAPLADHLALTLRPLFQELIPRDDEFEMLFDEFEYLLLLAYGSWEGASWVPTGRLIYRWRKSKEYGGVKKINEDILRGQADWPLLRLGLFNGSVAKFQGRKDKVDDYLERNYQGFY